ALVGLDEVDTGGGELDAQLALPRLRQGYIRGHEHLGTAVRRYLNRAHVRPNHERPSMLPPSVPVGSGTTLVPPAPLTRLAACGSACGRPPRTRWPATRRPGRDPRPPRGRRLRPCPYRPVGTRRPAPRSPVPRRCRRGECS